MTVASEVEVRAAHPSLAGVVLSYTGFVERAPGPVTMVELPCTDVPVIVDLAEGWTIGDPRRPGRPPVWRGSFVAGLCDGPVAVTHPSRAACVQIDLTPLGARRLLGVPMDGLANAQVSLADVVGPDAPLLAERIAGAATWDGRFALVDDALRRRLDRSGATVSAGVAWALGRIVESGGRAPIGGLAKELGWSPRRLVAGFRDGVGMPPKRVARIVRFERLGQALARPTAPDWARTAAALGFADQAHLAREVRDLAGMTPSSLRQRKVNFVQDPAPAAA